MLRCYSSGVKKESILESDDLRLAIQAAMAAGDVIRSTFGTVQKITSKGANDIATETDKRAEDSIVKILRENSSYAILTEETGNIDGSPEGLWVVDPLDGTTNFSRGIPLFGVSIALLKNGVLQLGVVLNPMTQECFHAEKGKGAFKNDRPLRVSGPQKTKVLILDGGHTKAEHEAYGKAAQILTESFLLRRLGTVALELCYVASGGYDGYVQYGDMLWDYAAGLCIVQEAGGKISDWKGNSLRMADRQYVLATNGRIHEEIVRKISFLQS